jgi:hypothetical protein
MHGGAAEPVVVPLPATPFWFAVAAFRPEIPIWTRPDRAG